MTAVACWVAVTGCCADDRLLCSWCTDVTGRQTTDSLDDINCCLRLRRTVASLSVADCACRYCLMVELESGRCGKLSFRFIICLSKLPPGMSTDGQTRHAVQSQRYCQILWRRSETLVRSCCSSAVQFLIVFTTTLHTFSAWFRMFRETGLQFRKSNALA